MLVTDGEQGLLGLAFDPNYATNGDFYVNYNATTSIVGSVSLTTIAEYHATSATIANPTALGTIFSTPQTDQTNHKGGWIAFSPRAGATITIYIVPWVMGVTPTLRGMGTLNRGAMRKIPRRIWEKYFGSMSIRPVPTASPFPPTTPFAGSASPVTKEILRWECNSVPQFL